MNKKTAINLSQIIPWLALFLILCMPFGLYFALQAGLMILAWVCFGFFVMGMLFVIWKG